MTYDLYALELSPGYYTHVIVIHHNDTAPLRYRRIAHNLTQEEIEQQIAMYPQVEIDKTVFD